MNTQIHLVNNHLVIINLLQEPRVSEATLPGVNQGIVGYGELDGTHNGESVWKTFTNFYFYTKWFV